MIVNIPLSMKPQAKLNHVIKSLNSLSQRPTEALLFSYLPKQGYPHEMPKELNRRGNLLQQKCHEHKKYCEQQLGLERQKFIEYYRLIIASISNQFEEGLHIIDRMHSSLSESFDQHCRHIEMLAMELHCKYRDLPLQDRLDILEEQAANLQVEFLDIELPDISLVQKEIGRFMLKQISKPQPLSQLESPMSKASSTVSGGGDESMERDSLACDQDLQMSPSAGVLRRRKYAVLRGQVIAQQDEWQESSSIVSD